MNIHCHHCDHHSMVFDEDREYPYCVRKERFLENAEIILARNVPAYSVGWCEGLSYEEPFIVIEDRKEMKCYYCDGGKDVLYPTIIKVEIKERARENCQVYMLYEILACKNCLNENEEVVLEVACPFCTWPMNLWHDSIYRCPRCSQALAYPFSPGDYHPGRT